MFQNTDEQEMVEQSGGWWTTVTDFGTVVFLASFFIYMLHILLTRYM